ncbi:TlpA family protein disulfide reductase [Pelagibacterales bacterium SAG-MED15]|nr:TlpA family protein disulfide reductase [Pelagibacterales bacterium SAG-MED15]
MKLLSYKFFLVVIYLISTVISFSDEPNIKNLIIHKQNKKLKNITFLDVDNKPINLNEFTGQLVIINFWATWCAPCKEEMPSLDNLKNLKAFENLKILPINVGQEDIQKSKIFFDDLKIKNLELYFDNSIKLAKTFTLRGLPTSVIINKEGDEFARIIGSIDFGDENFIKWLSKFN